MRWRDKERKSLIGFYLLKKKRARAGALRASKKAIDQRTHFLKLLIISFITSLKSPCISFISYRGSDLVYHRIEKADCTSSTVAGTHK